MNNTEIVKAVADNSLTIMELIIGIITLVGALLGVYYGRKSLKLQENEDKIHKLECRREYYQSVKSYIKFFNPNLVLMKSSESKETYLKDIRNYEHLVEDNIRNHVNEYIKESDLMENEYFKLGPGTKIDPKKQNNFMKLKRNLTNELDSALKNDTYELKNT